MATKTRFPGSRDWANTAYWSGGSVPSNGDSVVMFEGSDQIDQNLPASLSLVNFTRGPGCRSGLGSRTAPFAPTITGEMVLAGELPPGYFDHLGAGASGIAVLRHVGYSPELILSAGTVAHLAAAGRGRVHVTQGCVLTALVTDHPEAQVDIDYKSDAIDELLAIAGQVRCERGVKALEALTNGLGAIGRVALLRTAYVSDTEGSGVVRINGGEVHVLSDPAAGTNSAQIDGSVILRSGLLSGRGNTYGNVVITGDLTQYAQGRKTASWDGGALVVNGDTIQMGGTIDQLQPLADG